MFSSKSDSTDTPPPKPEDGVPSIITKPIVIKGDVNAECDVHIEGKLEGNVTSTSNVYISTSAMVTGNIKAKGVTIKGEVNGIVEADTATIAEGGYLLGELNYRRIIISDGGTVEGTLKCQDKVKGEVVDIIKPKVKPRDPRP